MNKAILVIDMPDDCFECNFCVELSAQDRCVAAGKRIFTLGKPDWCPLKPAPEKDEVYYLHEWSAGYKKGWNDCVNYVAVETTTSIE